MEQRQPALQENLAFHPYNIMLFLLLFGLTLLFLALTISYVYIRVTMDVEPVQLPGLFLFNTLILLGSSYTMIRAKQAYLNDDTVAIISISIVTCPAVGLIAIPCNMPHLHYISYSIVGIRLCIIA